MAIAVPEIIGRGTWLDKVAQDVLDRQRRLGRLDQTVMVESGLGASGIPHLGTFADGARAWGVKMALSSAGNQAEYIAFSDDKDGAPEVSGRFTSPESYGGETWPVGATRWSDVVSTR